MAELLKIDQGGHEFSRENDRNVTNFLLCE